MKKLNSKTNEIPKILSVIYFRECVRPSDTFFFTQELRLCEAAAPNFREGMVESCLLDTKTVSLRGRPASPGARPRKHF